jgi:saccharopine dehydrogenase (NADP+, L-glutamate forming)
MKKVLVLGAGLVTRPHVQYLLDVPDFHVTVASRTVSKAEKNIGGRANGTAVQLNVTDEAKMAELIAQSDLAVSMLPFTFHPVVARYCIENKKDMVTTSYVSDAMQALDGPAKEAGVFILNEIGVDPGIDHMSAMQIIDRVRAGGGEVASFTSWCGGLPAPDANTNPLGYKFSWSPRGVLLAGKNSARWRKDGKEINVPGEELFDHRWPVDIEGLGQLEGYPNRDSLPYADVYNLPDVKTIFRGTLRNVGWCETIRKLVAAGWFGEEPVELKGLTYGQLTAKLLGTQGKDIRKEAMSSLNITEDSYTFKNSEWLGLFSDDPLPLEEGSPLDVMVENMLAKMQYAEGERDMLVMQHEFLAEYPDKKEEIISTMIDYGIPHGDTSMSRTVGLPASIAARMILQGEFRLTGVHRPVAPDIYNPILAELEKLGIGFKEKVETLD